MPIKTRIYAGGIAAAFPDIDYISAWINPLLFIADWHRAETHSLILLPLWAMALAWVFSTLWRRRGQFREFVFVCALGIFSHIFTDLITSWGVQVFAPLSSFAPALSVSFVIDPYFTAILACALATAIIKESPRSAQVGLVLLISYSGLQVFLKTQAENIAQNYVASEKLPAAQVYAMPQPFSPFNWKLIISTGTHYQMAYINLLADKAMPDPIEEPAMLWDIGAYYRPAHALSWKPYSLFGTEERLPSTAPFTTPKATSSIIMSAWTHPDMAPFRRFSRYPVLYKVDKTQTHLCVWFVDLRFMLPTMTTPFRYGMCKRGDGKWLGVAGSG